MFYIVVKKDVSRLLIVWFKWEHHQMVPQRSGYFNFQMYSVHVLCIGGLNYQFQHINLITREALSFFSILRNKLLRNFEIIQVAPLHLREMFELFSDYLKSSPSYFPSFPILNFNEFSTSILAICPNIQNGCMHLWSKIRFHIIWLLCHNWESKLSPTGFWLCLATLTR